MTVKRSQSKKPSLFGAFGAGAGVGLYNDDSCDDCMSASGCGAFALSTPLYRAMPDQFVKEQTATKSHMFQFPIDRSAFTASRSHAYVSPSTVIKFDAVQMEVGR